MENPRESSSRIPQPADKICIESLTVKPYPDRYRILIGVKVTPFQARPNLLLVARNQQGKIVGELDVIATMHTAMEFTLHLRNVQDPAGEYTLTAELFFETRNPPQDRCEATFVVPISAEDME